MTVIQEIPFNKKVNIPQHGTKEMCCCYMFQVGYEFLVKGCQYSKFSMWKGPGFPNLVCERVRG